MSRIVAKFRTFGFKGFFCFVASRWRAWLVWLRLVMDAVRHPLEPARGVTVVAEFGASNSLNKTMRDFVIMLRRAGIPYQTLDITGGERRNQDIDDLLTPVRDFRARRYGLVVEMLKGVYPRLRGVRRSRVVFWEAATGVTEAFPFLRDGRLAIGMSDFNHETVRRELGNGKAVKVLYPFVFECDSPVDGALIRARFGIPAAAFMVFFNFDYTAYGRKNPEGIVRAFARAFTAADKAVLVFKTVKREAFPVRASRLRAAVDAAGLADRFVEIGGYIPREDVYGLTAACDAYISLHRGEGFGLGIAEAMSLGKPVVVTDYSSTTEFCRPDNACLIPFESVPLSEKDRDDLPYSWAIDTWAEPDVDAAAAALRDLYDKPSVRMRVGAAAKQFMRDRFSVTTFRQSMELLFEQIGKGL